MGKLISMLVLLFVGCGQVPSHSEPIPADAHIASVSHSELQPVRVCGISFIVMGGQVYRDSAIVSNGSYTLSGYFIPPGVYIPSCTYMVLDGRVCYQSCARSNW